MEGEDRPLERSISTRVLKEMRDLTVGNDTVVLADIQKHVLRQAMEPDYERERRLLHPSDMAKSDWCWRSDYYRMTNAPEDPRSANPSFRMENVWTEGHDIHHKWQRWLWEMGILYGVFQCRVCGYRWWDRAPKECFACGEDDLRYREIPLEAPHLHIGGHADGGLWLDDQPFRLLEIKSIGLNSLRFDAPDLWDRYQNNESLDKIWMEINRPFASHVRQGSLYLYMAIRGWAEVPVPTEIVFIYEWKPTQAVKEFVVRYSPRWVDRLLAGAQQVTDALDLGRPPPRPPWAKDEDARICAGCSYRTVCWRLDHREDPPATLPVGRAPVAVRRRAFAHKATAGRP